MKESVKLKNSQRFIAKIFLILAVVFTLLAVLPFRDGNPLSGVWPLAFMSIFLTLSSSMITFIFFAQGQKNGFSFVWCDFACPMGIR